MTLVAEGYLCQLAGAEQSRPIGVNKGLHDGLSMEWPRLRLLGDGLIYDGPLPNHCPCTPPRWSYKGLNEAEDFVSSSPLALGVRFWFVMWPLLQNSLVPTLRDGSLFADGLCSSGRNLVTSDLLEVADIGMIDSALSSPLAADFGTSPRSFLFSIRKGDTKTSGSRTLQVSRVLSVTGRSYARGTEK